MYYITGEYDTETNKWYLKLLDGNGEVKVDVTTSHPGVMSLILERIMQDFIEETQRYHSANT